MKREKKRWELSFDFHFAFQLADRNLRPESRVLLVINDISFCNKLPQLLQLIVQNLRRSF